MSAHAIAGLGHNSPPPDIDFIDLRIVYETARYLQWKFGGLDDLMLKRSGGRRAMGFRKIMCSALRGVVPRDSLAKILGINSKTMGEDQQRPDVWAEDDEGFAIQNEHLRQAVIGNAMLEVAVMEERLEELVRTDPERRTLEKQQRLHELAAKRADLAAAELKSRAKARAVETDLRKALGNAPNADAIIAKHKGAKAVARDLSESGVAAIEVLAKLAADKRKPRRALTSELNAAGLKEALRLGLAHNAEPYMSAAPDPQIGLSELGGRVYLECVALGRVGKGK